MLEAVCKTCLLYSSWRPSKVCIVSNTFINEETEAWNPLPWLKATQSAVEHIPTQTGFDAKAPALFHHRSLISLTRKYLLHARPFLGVISFLETLLRGHDDDPDLTDDEIGSQRFCRLSKVTQLSGIRSCFQA